METILQTWCCNCKKWIDGTRDTYKTYCPDCGRYRDDIRRKPLDGDGGPGRCPEAGGLFKALWELRKKSRT